MTDPLSLTAPQLTDALRAAEAEIERLRAGIASLSDPAVVWVNMLRGQIARPRHLVERDVCRREALEEAAKPIDALAERWQQQADIAEDEGDRAEVEVMTEVATASRECAATIRGLIEDKP